MTKLTEKSVDGVVNNTEVESLEALESFYRRYSNEQPHSDIDKQILAAAERELAAPKAKKLVYSSWWRRLLLPLYAATTFAFTAIAAHWLWPAPVMVPPGTAKGPVIIDVLNQDSEQRAKQGVNAEKKRVPQSLPSIQVPIIPPDKKLTRIPVADNHSDLKSLRKAQVEDINSLPVKAKQVARLSYPDKESWAREIIQLLKQGEHELAQKELLLFKKSHPDYPIDEQVELFRHQ